MPACNVATARARLFTDAIAFRALTGLAERRAGHIGPHAGARPPAALGGARVHLEALTDPAPEGSAARPVTPLGYRTAIRALPPTLARLDRADPRRKVALMLADAAERIGSVGGAGWGGSGGGGDTSGGQSDGGATTRCKWAIRLRRLRDLAQGASYGPGGKMVMPAAPRVALPVQRKGGKRQEIKAWALVWALCVEGQDLTEILALHGWPKHSKHIKRLGDAALEILSDMA